MIKVDYIVFDLPDILNDIRKIYEPMMFSKISKREEQIISTLLHHTKIKEPISYGKLKWHGIRMVENSTSCEWWIEQRGVMIGLKHKL